MVAIVFFIVLVLLSIWALFWIIRLAVRYGVNDALRDNRAWLARRDTGGIERQP